MFVKTVVGHVGHTVFEPGESNIIDVFPLKSLGWLLLPITKFLGLLEPEFVRVFDRLLPDLHPFIVALYIGLVDEALWGIEAPFFLAINCNLLFF